MSIINFTMDKYWSASVPQQSDYGATNHPITVGRYHNINYYSDISKVKITIPRAGLYRSNKLVITSQVLLNETYPGICSVFISKADLTAKQTVNNYNVDYGGPSQLLMDNSLGRGEAYDDPSGDEATRVNGQTRGAGQTIYYVIKDLELNQIQTEENEEYYLYFLLTWRNIGAYSGGISDISLDYIPYVQLSAPQITSASTIIRPIGDNLNISWNPVENAIGYNLTVKDSQNQQLLVQNNIMQTKAELTMPDLSAYRGQSLTALIQSIGEEKSQYLTSNYSEPQVIAQINLLPGAPQISNEPINLINSITSTFFDVQPGENVENQTLTLYYSLNGQSEKYKFLGQLEITTSTLGVKAGLNTIYFYTYDTLEYSDSTQFSFTANYAPVVNMSAFGHTFIDNQFNIPSNLVKTTEIKYSLVSGAVTSAKIYYATANAEVTGNDWKEQWQELKAPSAIILNTSTNTITIQINKIPQSMIPYGNLFRFAYELYDGTAGTSLRKEPEGQTIARRPFKPKPMKNIDYVTDAIDSSRAVDGYYKRKVTINFTREEKAAGYAKLSLVQVVARYGEDQKRIFSTYPGDPNTSLTFSQEIDLQEIDPGVPVNIYYSIVDEAGQQTVPDEASPQRFNLVKTTTLSYINSAITPSLTEIKPLSNTKDFTIEHSPAVASGTKEMIYRYEIDINGNKQDLRKAVTESQGESILSTFLKEDINEQIKELVINKNTTYTATISVIAEDAFGATGALNFQLPVNFIEPPSFPVGSSLRIKHDYWIDRIISGPNHGVEITDLNTKMFNAREGIIFVLPKVIDLNDDIQEYQIFLSRNTLNFTSEDEALDNSQVTFETTPFKTISRSNLDRLPKDDYYYYYRYPASQYTKNEYFYFKVLAKDSLGNYSNSLITEDYIIGCRTAQPSFEVRDVQIEQKDSSLKVKYDFFIEDLGGSAFGEWDENYYNFYPNFDRAIEGYVPQITLKIELSSDQDFNLPLVKTITKEGSPLLGFESNEVTFEGFEGNSSKIFLRFTMAVSYGILSIRDDQTALATVESSPLIRAYFGNIPTVSYRSHKVGINTNEFGEDDALVVQSYQGNTRIILKGKSLDGISEHLVTLDLLTGTIDGAIISGGTW